MPHEKPEQGIRPLTALAPGERATVARLDGNAGSGTLPKLLALGILPGCRVEMIRSFPSYLFRIGRTQVAVDARIAGAVGVRQSS